MARPPRPVAAGLTYHVTAHCLDGRTLFLDDLARRFYLATFARAVREHGWICRTYCLMDTHIHLVFQTPGPTISAGMQRLQSQYAQYDNRRRSRRGPVWDGRFAAEVIERERHLLEALRYVALNPVRAQMCTDPAAWPWSGHRALAGLTAAPSFLAVRDTHDAVAPGTGTAGYLALVAGALRVPETTAQTLTAAAAAPARFVVTAPVQPPFEPLPADIDDDALARAHREEGRSMSEIARQLGCHRSTVLRRLRTYDAQRNGV